MPELVRDLRSRAGVKRLVILLLPLAGCSMAPAGERPAAFAPAVAAPVATHAHRHGASQESAHAMPRAAAQPRVRTAQVPLVFEADSLSSSQESRFIARTPRYAVRVSSSGAEIALRPGSPAHAAEPITMRFAGASPGIRRVETDRAGVRSATSTATTRGVADRHPDLQPRPLQGRLSGRRRRVLRHGPRDRVRPHRRAWRAPG